MLHLRYLRVVLTHKWFVFRAGLKTGAPLWRLVIHDWSKFTPAEWGPYARRFGCGRAGLNADAKDAHEWILAWTHHWHWNPHHWEHWFIRDATYIGGFRKIDIPEPFIREMVADWMGAGRAYTGRWDISEWYLKNQHRVQMTANTRARVEEILSEISI